MVPSNLPLKIKINEVEYIFSHCLLENIVGSEVAAVANAHLKWCDIVLGGNHGQGAFHWPVKFVLKYDNQPTVELEKWLAEIVCDKESYDIFKKTLANPLAKSMLPMFEDKDIGTGADKDGRFLVNKITKKFVMLEGMRQLMKKHSFQSHFALLWLAIFPFMQCVWARHHCQQAVIYVTCLLQNGNQLVMIRGCNGCWTAF